MTFPALISATVGALVFLATATSLGAVAPQRRRPADRLELFDSLVDRSSVPPIAARLRDRALVLGLALGMAAAAERGASKQARGIFERGTATTIAAPSTQLGTRPVRRQLRSRPL